MAWTTPPTFTNTVLTAAQMNIIRDDLNETAPAKATTAGSLFVATGANSLAQRIPTEVTEFARESTTSTTYVNLATPGPELTLTTSTRALIGVTAGMLNSTLNWYTAMSFIVYDGGTSTTSVPPDDNYSIITREGDGGGSTAPSLRASGFRLLTSLTAQSNRFQAKYRVGGGTGTWDDRSLLVIPL